MEWSKSPTTDLELLHPKDFKALVFVHKAVFRKFYDIAEAENCDWEQADVLQYLAYTLHRVTVEKKLLEDNSAYFFNTGILTKEGGFIYGCLENNKKQRPPFVLKILDTYEISEYIPLQKLPDRPLYYNKYSELLVDTELLKEMNIEHINIKHLMENFVNRQGFWNSYEVTKVRQKELILRAAIASSIKKTIRTPLFAVPIYFLDKNSTVGELQHMIPVEIPRDGEHEFAFALVLSKARGHYRGTTLLSRTQSIRMARLVMQPYATWLYRYLY